MKKFFITAFLTVFASSMYAAEFTFESNVKSPASQKVLTVGVQLASQTGVFGDLTSSTAYNFTRKPTEKDLNTLKQLNMMKSRIFKEDADQLKDMTSSSVDDLVEYLLEAVSNSEDTSNEAAFKKARTDLAAALKAVKADQRLKVFGVNHADEDGSFQILNIFDLEHKQIVVVRVGYIGT